LENYCLSEDVEMLESLEHGSIIFWQKIWDELDPPMATSKYPTCGRVKIPRRQDYFNVLIYFGEIHVFFFFILLFLFGLG